MKDGKKINNYISGQIYFFDIPVFRCSFEKWYEEQMGKKEALARYYEVKEFIPTNNIERINIVFDINQSKFRYNEMIGMIKLFAIHLQIRGELWSIRERRLQKRGQVHLLSKGDILTA